MLTFSQLGNYGRIGNSFFQAASTIGIAIKNNEAVLFPEYGYNQYLKNPLPTGNFNINERYQEPHFHYSDISVNNSDLLGYFQSEKYFKHCEGLIRNYFTLKDEHTNYLKNKYPYILNQDSVSIHVRRGDYLTKQEWHTVQPIEYYNTAINIIGDDKKYFVFSDDLEWCKQNFIGDKFTFVQEDKDIFEMFLQSYCKHHIIANSSFSWWGAWLNTNPNKIVIAPKNWFGPSYENLQTQDLTPEKWILI